MGKILSVLPINQGLVLGLAVLGCAVAGLLTGHLASGDFMTLAGVVTGAGGAVTAVHVAGNVANQSSTTDPATMTTTTGTQGTV